ncbi:uncharacterized protein LOC122055713 isoform X3 [Zingiber officinale]|uniref:Protein Lines C-terminal domain-containing protein n=1 Tax=Zingiber officinale TaxID=94328 RepID=A0A8J5LMV9_ZINOF|nr:uncharacterized protein LOC122055713 isoform X3 [Zingiber officinale]KAG6532000.1 hypothetical protein ZIOFF_005837 [Zingiber officinale]
MVGVVPRLCDLIRVSLSPYLEPKPFSLTKESEKDLLISLSRVRKAIQRWNDESEFDGNPEKDADCHFHVTCCIYVNQQTEVGSNCFMDIVSTMVPFLGLESGFVRHLVGKLFVDMSNLLAVCRTKWIRFVRLLWISHGIAMSSIISSSPMSTRSIHIPNESWLQSFMKSEWVRMENSAFDISTFVDLLHLKVFEINLFMVEGLFQIFRNILKSSKNDINNLKGAYTYIALSSLLKMPWSWLNEIHTRHISSGEDGLLGSKNFLPRPTNMISGIILQLLCSLCEQKDLIDAEGVSAGGHVIYTEFAELVIKLLPGFFEHLRCKTNLSRYLKHKLLMLMTRLRSHVQDNVSHLVLWLELLKHNFQDLLYMPISDCSVGPATVVKESPFLANFDDGDKLQNLCTKHLWRQITFLFLHCCFRLVHFDKKSGYQFHCEAQSSCVTSPLKVCGKLGTSMGLMQFFEWLQRLFPLENIVDYESFRESCCTFAAFFLQLYLEEDDMLFDILLQLLDAPVINLQICSSGEEIHFEEEKKSAVFVISSIFNPIYLFHVFLLLLHYDHLVLVDYLISKDTGIRFLQYLLRCLRVICTFWQTFMELSTFEGEKSQPRHKRRKIMYDKLESAPSSSTTKGLMPSELFSVSDADKSILQPNFENAKVCLLNLKKTVEDLHRKDLFPYNPEPLIRRFVMLLYDISFL